MCIPRRPESRLYLRKVVPPRMHKTAEDYRVFRFAMIGDLRNDDHVGDVWLDPKLETMEDKISPWRWSIDTTRGGVDKDGWWAHGRARTREEAMDAFRNAWDTYQPRRPSAGEK